MQYDPLGFPIPAEFAPPDPRDERFFSPRGVVGDRPRRPEAGRRKRGLVLTLVLGGLLPAVLVPGSLPAVREAVVQWSVDRAAVGEVRGRLQAAIGDLDRAIEWTDDAGRLAQLLCWRGMLLIENGDARGAVADADRAVAVAPTSAQPRRVRALAQVVLADADAALVDAEAAVDLAGESDPEALNHRAYVRALVGRDLEAALVDVDRALAAAGSSPEYLDTRGFILHLLGRQHEAVDQLNLAIDELQQRRRQLTVLARHADADEVAYRVRSIEQSLGVMHHHRGLACRALGLEGQARQDFDEARRKGYAPERGIF